MAMRVLVVDDDQVTRAFFLRALPTGEFEVIAVSGGEEAVGAVKRGRFHLAFVDMIMPSMDGLSTLKAIRAEQPDLAVIMMTGYAVEDNLILAFHLGAVDFLYKPFESADDILGAIQRFKKRQQLKPLGNE